MRGTTYKRCGCRNPETGEKYPAGKCPKLVNRDHGAWWARYDAPAGSSGRRRQPTVGPFKTKKAAQQALTEELAKFEIHGRQLDRSLKTGAYLETIWLPAKKESLSSSTFADYTEIVQLYLVPGLGHLKLVDLRDKHVIRPV